MIMDYVIRGEEEKLKKTEVWLEKGSDGRIILCVEGCVVFALYPNGTGKLPTGMCAGNSQRIQVEKDGRIKLVD